MAIDGILECLERRRIRATYGAVAEKGHAAKDAESTSG